MKKYLFDTQVACEVGVDSAIMFENLVFWIERNKANEVNFHDGSYWTYNSIKAFCELFPFWSRRTIDRILHGLEVKGYIKSGNYNASPYNRTKWYALTEKGEQLAGVSISPNREMKFTERGNEIHGTGKTTITDNKHKYKPDAAAAAPLPEKPLSETPTTDTKTAKVFTLFQNNIHPITGQIEADSLSDLLNQYGEMWVEAAIKEAALNNGRSVKYVSSILQRWAKDGFKVNRKARDSYGRNTTVGRSRPENEGKEREWTPASNGWD